MLVKLSGITIFVKRDIVYMPYLFLIIFLAAAFLLQFLTGNFPVSLMAFPLNLILAAIWYGSMYLLWKRRNKSLFVQFMLSPGATFWSIFLFTDACVVIGLTGMRSLTTTWVFLFILLFLLTVLFFVILRGWRQPTQTGARLGKIRWRFLLNHVGLSLALGAGFWGAPDSETVKLMAFEGKPVEHAVIPGVGRVNIKYDVFLEDFRLERFENGVPSMFEADVKVDGKPVNLRVNHPYSITFADQLYLSGYDSKAGEESAWCTMQIVHEPWKCWAATGILMMLAGALMMFVQGPRRRQSIND